MTSFTIGCWVVVNIIITGFCWLVLSWADHHLFTYLGEAEINGEWKMCYMYHTLTIPARIVAFLCGVAAIAVFVTTWAAFIGLVIA